MKVTVSFLNNLEEQIRAGTAPSVEKFINSHSYKVPRPLIARYVNLLRRLGGPKWALNILNPIIRNKANDASTDEIIEYATCLCRVGLIDESIALLNRIIHEPHPEIQFELAAAHMSKWEFSNCIPYLLKYLESKELSTYKVCVGELNLATAYIYTNDLQKAESLLKNLIEKTKENKFLLLLGNSLELRGEIAFANRDFDRAMNFFKESSKYLRSANPRYRLYQEKWKIITNMIKESGSAKSLHECNQLRMELAKIEDWNSLRELELYKSVVTKDIKGITDLYYGIPYLDYRKRILATWGHSLDLNDESYERRVGPGDLGKNKVFDIATGTDLYSGAQLKVGQNMHRLLTALTSDFYAPFSTTRIFYLVFKDSFFNPLTSPKQVHQLVLRLNEWFKTKKISFIVSHGRSGYRLRASKAYILRIPTNIGVTTKVDAFLRLLQNNHLTKDFQVKDVAKSLEISHRNATRLLSEAVACGKLERHRLQRSTLYSILLQPLKL